MPPRRSARADRRGFTILEAAVALSIIGMAAMGALSSFGSEMRAGSRAQLALPAVALAEERLAVFQIVPASRMSALPDSLRRGRFAPPLERYAWTAHASAVNGEPDLYDVTVRVSWTEGEYELRSRIYRQPPRVAR